MPIVPIYLSVCLSLVLPVSNALAQHNRERSIAFAPTDIESVPPAITSLKTSKKISIQADVAELRYHLLKNPNDAVTLNNLATKYVGLGRVDEAWAF